MVVHICVSNSQNTNQYLHSTLPVPPWTREIQNNLIKCGVSTKIHVLKFSYNFPLNVEFKMDLMSPLFAWLVSRFSTNCTKKFVQIVEFLHYLCTSDCRVPEESCHKMHRRWKTIVIERLVRHAHILKQPTSSTLMSLQVLKQDFVREGPSLEAENCWDSETLSREWCKLYVAISKWISSIYQI